MSWLLAIFMDSSWTWWAFLLNWNGIQRKIIQSFCFWETMLIVDNTVAKSWPTYLHWNLSIQKTCLCLEEITNLHCVQILLASEMKSYESLMRKSMTNSFSFSNPCHLLQLLTAILSVCTGVFLQDWQTFVKLTSFIDFRSHLEKKIF